MMVPFHRIFTIDDVNMKLNTFNSMLLELFNIHAPFRMVRITKPYAPWMTDNLRFLIKLRDKAKQQWKRTRFEGHFNYYKTLRNQVTFLCRTEKKNTIHIVSQIII